MIVYHPGEVLTAEGDDDDSGDGGGSFVLTYCIVDVKGGFYLCSEFRVGGT